MSGARDDAGLVRLGRPTLVPAAREHAPSVFLFNTYVQLLQLPGVVCVCVFFSHLFWRQSHGSRRDVYFTLQCIQGTTLCSVFSVLLNQPRSHSRG